MDGSTVNFWAVLVAAVAYMALGALWFSPALFANSWMKGIGKTKEQLTKDFSPVNYVWAFISSVFASYGVARVLSWYGGGSIVDGVKVGLLVGICFVLGSIWVNETFEGRPRRLTLVNGLYHVVGLVVAGVIVGAWL